MPIYRITFRDGRVRDLDGDDVTMESSGAVIVWRDVTFMLSTRRTVGQRYLASDGVASVDVITS